jgi:hypothetical protein
VYRFFLIPFKGGKGNSKLNRSNEFEWRAPIQIDFRQRRIDNKLEFYNEESGTGRFSMVSCELW